MKKTLIALAFGLCSSFAMAAPTLVCNNSSTPSANVPGATDGSLFVRVTFAPTCSTNTVLVQDDDGTKVWAGSASSKGQSLFGGSTNGGSVGNMGQCNSGKACGTAGATKTAVDGIMTAAKALGNT